MEGSVVYVYNEAGRSLNVWQEYRSLTMVNNNNKWFCLIHLVFRLDHFSLGIEENIQFQVRKVRR